MTRPDYDMKWREDAALYEHQDRLEAETIEWFTKFNRGNERMTKANEQQVSEYTSRSHRNGISYERMLSLSKSYLIFTVWDDFFDINPNLCDRITTSLMDITTNNKIVAIDHSDPENYLLSAWSDAWKDVVCLSPKHWQEHFALSLQYWFASVKIENGIRGSKRLLNYNEYHPLRLTSMLVEVCLDFIEFAQNEYLRMEDRVNSTFMLLCTHAKTIVYLTNDLYSWPKEKRVGDNMNIIHIHQELSKMSEAEAITDVVGKLNKNLDAIYCIMDNYRPLMSPGVEFYFAPLSRYLRGNYDFHRRSRRYD